MQDEPRLYGVIKETFLLLDFGDQRLFAQFDLTVPRYYALYHIYRCPGLSPGQLSTYMFCDKSNVSRLLRSLEKAGAVERRPHETDGRSLRIYLTPEGCELLTAVSAAHAEYTQERVAMMPESDQQQVIEILNAYNAPLQRDLHPELDETAQE